MLAYRADDAAFRQIPAYVDRYLDHWFSLVENGVNAPNYAAEVLAKRDRDNREIIFNPDVDKVWAQVDRLVGNDTSARMREILKDQSI